MNRLTLTTLRALIAVLVAGAALAQLVFIPWIAYATAQDFPEVDYLAIPYAVLAIATIGCAEAILVATWRLAGMVAREQIFDERAVPLVTLMVRSAGLATVLVGAVAVHAIVVEGLGPITVPLTLLGGTVAAGASTVILVVLRGLLRAAVQHKAELDEGV